MFGIIESLHERSKSKASHNFGNPEIESSGIVVEDESSTLINRSINDQVDGLFRDQDLQGFDLDD